MVGPVTATEDTLASLRQWFSRVKLASLELPHGWFGRPYDNLHQLTWSAATTHKVLLELDHQILLILTDPGPAEITSDLARIKDCLHVTLDWQEYANMKPRLDDHGNGNVTLHGQTSP